MALSDEQLTLVTSLETQLIALDAVIQELELLGARQSTTAPQRARIVEILSDLKLRYSLLYPQYKAAEVGQSHLKPPTDKQFKKVCDLSDKVEKYMSGQKATEASIDIAGEVIELVKEVS